MTDREYAIELAHALREAAFCMRYSDTLDAARYVAARERAEAVLANGIRYEPREAPAGEPGETSGMDRCGAAPRSQVTGVAPGRLTQPPREGGGQP